jgi:hypothetical protein
VRHPLGALGDRLLRLRLRVGLDLDVAGLELGADLGELLLVEVMLESERLEGTLLDRAALLRLVEELRDNKFKSVAQFVSLPSAFVGSGSARSCEPPTCTTTPSKTVFRPGPPFRRAGGAFVHLAD